MSTRTNLRRRRLLRLPRTMRGRLVALLAVVLTLGFVATALVTVLVVRHVLFDRLDAQLKAAGDRYAISLEHNDHDADNGPSQYGDVEGQLAGTLGARLLHGRVTDAAIIASNNTADQVPAAARARLAQLKAVAGPASIELPQLGTYRITVTAGRDGDLQVTGLPAEPVEDTITRLVIIEALVLGVALLVLVAAATVAVRLMLRPLARIAHTAETVSALPMESGGGSVPHRVMTESHSSEIDTLSRGFNAMLDQVESALVTRAASEDRLRRFIADASHELRTPIAVVRSHAELAQRAGDTDDDVGSILPEPVTHSLERITAQAARMGYLVEDLLLLARLDSGRRLTHESVDLARITVDAVDDIRTTATDHRWLLAAPPRSLWIEGDAHALTQAVTNLLANAAAHTPAGTTVTITITDPAAVPSATPRVGAVSNMQLTVADDGPGMSADLAARAFDRFVRGDHARALSRGSSGLGLPIVAAIAAAHGGIATIESGPEGTRAQLNLPCCVASAPAGPVRG